MFNHNFDGVRSVEPMGGTLCRVTIPSLDDELNNLFSVGRSMGFYNNNKRYAEDLVLPQNERLRELIQIDNPGKDEINEARLLVEKEYDPAIYEEASKIYHSPEFCENFMKAKKHFKLWQCNWGFKVFDDYNIILSRWGLRGKTGRALGSCYIRVNEAGMLEEKADPAQIPIHESIHNGVYDINHPLREAGLLSNWENESTVRHLQGIIPGFEQYRANISRLSEKYPTDIDKFMNDEARLNTEYPACMNEFVEWRKANTR